MCMTKHCTKCNKELETTYISCKMCDKNIFCYKCGQICVGCFEMVCPKSLNPCIDCRIK